MQEILKSLNISDDNIKAINEAVDIVIESKLIVKENEIKTLQGNLEKTRGELTPFKEQERKNKIKSLIKGLTDDEKLDDVITLSGISEDDDEATIKEKATKTIEAKSYLAKTVIDDSSAKENLTKKSGTETETPKAKPKEYKFIDATIE